MRIWATVATLLLMTGAGSAAAAGIDFSNAAFAPAAGRTSVPIGHYEFCQTHPAECGLNKVVDAVTLTPQNWDELVAANNRVNVTVQPVSDKNLYRVAEYWAYPQGAGDCEDFVLEKRRALLQEGWPASALLIAVVLKKDGEGHAVLLVRTDRGDLALDNLDGEIHVWNETPYTYLKRQDQADSASWVGLRDDRVILVASMHEPVR
jgi:predicted transglutaminase-like cysteine proteinase